MGPCVRYGLGVVMVVALSACSGGDEPSEGSSSGGSSSGATTSSSGSGSSSGATTSSSSGGGSSSGGSTNFLDEIDGIGMPLELGLCGNIVPGISSDNIEFTWNGAPDTTTQYAVRLSKTATANKDDLAGYTTMIERVQAEASVATNEKVSGTTYRIAIYALQDRTPLCVLSGFNSTDVQ